MRPSVDIEVHESFDDVRAEWGELAAKTRNVFATPSWLEAWWRHFGTPGRLRLVAARTGGRAVAFLPLYEWRRRPVRVLRFLGRGAGDELGPVVDPADLAVAAPALAAAVRRLRARLVLAEHIPEAMARAAFSGARVLTREGSPLVHVGGRTWDEYLAGRSANFRQQVRRRERQLARHGEVAFRLSIDEARLPADLDVLFRLHAERWGARSTSYAQRESFHREYAAEAARLGLLRLWFLEIDGEAVAAWHGFRFEAVESYFQAGRSSAWADASVGFVLLAHTLREAFGDGMAEYRFLRGAEPFKYRFAEDDPGLVTLAAGRGLTGGVVAAFTSGAAAAKRRLRV